MNLNGQKYLPQSLDYYLEVIDYFFRKQDLHFRSLIIRDKAMLRHEDFMQDHNTWYYKMFFHLLNVIFEPHDASYHIYLDVKDTCSGRKIKKLHEVLCNKNYDFSRDIIKRVQAVRSDEIEILQVVDLLIGALAYVNRDLSSSQAKIAIIEKIKKLSGYSLNASTLLREKKFNLFFWSPNKGGVE